MREIKFEERLPMEEIVKTLRDSQKEYNELCYTYVDGERIYSSDTVAAALVKIKRYR